MIDIFYNYYWSDMKYKQEIHMKIDVPWPFLSESVACFITPLYQFIDKEF